MSAKANSELTPSFPAHNRLTRASSAEMKIDHEYDSIDLEKKVKPFDAGL